MLSAKREQDGKTVFAYFESKRNAPFRCLDCNEVVVFKCGERKIAHFSHVSLVPCQLGRNESDLHRRCKKEIYESLLQEPNVQDVALERTFGSVRPDISARIKGIRVAIEVQISSLPLEIILARTIEYHRLGIYVLWILQWTSKLDEAKYTPQLWEKWIHAAYFGRVYYWTGQLNVVSYRFDPSLKSVPKSSFVLEGKRIEVRGYTRRLKRFRSPVRGGTFNLAKDFYPRQRSWWEGGGLKVPDGKLFMEK